MTAALVAGVLAVGLAPAASAAEAAPVDIRMTPGMMSWSSRGWWEARSMANLTLRFEDIGNENLDGLTIFISTPEEIELHDYSGDGWTCRQTGGGTDCHIDDLVVPGEAWPELTVRHNVRTHMSSADSIDIYAKTGAHDSAHEGIPFKTDTSL